MSRRPTIVPEQDLIGATPETLALALLGGHWPRPGGKAVVGEEPPEAEPGRHVPGDDLDYLLRSG